MNRPLRSSSPAPTRSGRLGRRHELLMHMRPTLSLSILTAFALSLGSSGCFSPIVTELTTEGSSSGGGEESGTEADTTTSSSSSGIDPDDSSGAPPAVCGDGVVEGDEACDDGVNDGAYGGCTADCSALGPFCGDGVQNGGEDCDDGDTEDGNGCNVDCVVSGSVLWTVTYDGPDHGDDFAVDVEADSNNNIIVVGNVQVDGDTSVLVAKYTPEGQEIWSTSYSSPYGNTFAYDVAITPSDDIVVTASNANISGNQDAWIRKYSPSGDTVWTRTHIGPAGELDIAQSTTTDTANNIYTIILEGQVSLGNGLVSIIRKYDSDGQELWSIYEDPALRMDAVTILSSGSLILTGRTGDNTFWTPLLQEMNLDGGVIGQTVNDSHAPGSYSSISTNESGAIGLSLNPQGGNQSQIVVLSPDGMETWSDVPWGFNSSTRDVDLDDAGWLAATGTAGQDSTLWTRKYHSDGATAWTDTYNGPEVLLGFDQGEGIARDSNGNLITAGTVQDSEITNSDIWIRKLAP